MLTNNFLYRVEFRDKRNRRAIACDLERRFEASNWQQAKKKVFKINADLCKQYNGNFEECRFNGTLLREVKEFKTETRDFQYRFRKIMKFKTTGNKSIPFKSEPITD